MDNQNYWVEYVQMLLHQQQTFTYFLHIFTCFKVSKYCICICIIAYTYAYTVHLTFTIILFSLKVYLLNILRIPAPKKACVTDFFWVGWGGGVLLIFSSFLTMKEMISVTIFFYIVLIIENTDFKLVFL